MTSLQAFGNMTMNGGTISDGLFTVTGTITVKSGTINADATLTGAALFDKESSTTVTLNGNVFAASTTVNEGTLDVYGALTSGVTVNSAAIFKTEAGSTVTGSVDNYSTATSTLAGQVVDGGTTGISVYAGTVIVTSPNGPDDGAALTVGSLAATAFAPTAMEESIFLHGLTDGDSSDSDTGPVTDNGLTIVQETVGAGTAVLNALMSVRYPESASLAALSGSQKVQLAGDFNSIVFWAIANSGDSSVDLSPQTTSMPRSGNTSKAWARPRRRTTTCGRRLTIIRGAEPASQFATRSSITSPRTILVEPRFSTIPSALGFHSRVWNQGRQAPAGGRFAAESPRTSSD